MPYEVKLHPYFLKQYNNRWFLFGYNPLNEKNDWNLAIDRIVGIKEIKGRHKKNEIKWQEYFDDIIGVTKTTGEKAQEVRLQLILNYELERFILSYADRVKVVKPKILLNNINTKLKLATKNYE